ncbi:MAG: choice-of-anchor D domain-containing protein [Bacteroidota bacterium]
MPCSATLRPAALALLCCLLAVPSQAQTVLQTLESPVTSKSEFGTAVASVPDTDGDGADDLLVGAFSAVPAVGLSRPGRAYLYSGTTGAFLLELISPNEQTSGRFGISVAGLSDVNADGHGDLLVGAPREEGLTGRAYVFSGSDGALIYELVSPTGGAEQFGGSVAEVPDADGDGISELLVGAVGPFDGSGRAYLFSGATGALLYFLDPPEPLSSSELFANSVSGVPDTDGDGRGDLLVSLTGNTGRQAYLFSGIDGALLYAVEDPEPAPTAPFDSVDGIPDIDGDGRGDLIIGSGGDTAFDTEVKLYSGADGSLLYTLTSPFEARDGFGTSVAGVPDVDGDGATDILVSAPFSRLEGIEEAGGAFLFSGADGSLLGVLRSPNPERGGSFSGTRRDEQAVAGVRDIDGDGRGDLLIGAPGESVSGRAYLLRGVPLQLPALSVSPTSIDFSNVPVGSSETRTVLLRSTGSADLTITSLPVSGDADVFDVTAPQLPLTLPPGASDSLTVTFTPSVTQPFEGTLSVESNTFTRTVALEGTGFAGLTVTKSADTDDGVCDADCSLREAIAVANADAAGARIAFAPSLAGQTIAFAPGHGALLITEDLVIDGTGLGITVDAQRRDRVFLIEDEFPYATVELIGLTITGGYTTGNGGGILSPFAADLFITRCTITGNEAGGDGGGARMGGRVDESIVSDNVAGGDGGGLDIVASGGPVAVMQSTITNNTAGENGGGLSSDGEVRRNTISGNRAGNRGGGLRGGDTFAFFNTVVGNEAGSSGGGVSVNGEQVSVSSNVVVGNTSDGHSSDCSILFDFGGVGNNLSVTGCGGERVEPEEVFTLVVDPLLADNGGPTPTHLLLAPGNDPALNPAVDIRLCFSGDQRGFSPFDSDGDGEAECDLGAVELNAADLNPAVTLTLAPADSAVVIPAPGGPVPFTATLTNTSAASVTTQAWAAAVLPTGSLRLPVFGPVTVTLAPGQTLTRTLVQTVPGAAPAGNYTYAGYVGDFAGLAVTDRDTFGGQKAAGRTAMSGDGEWTVRDAATGKPVEAGDVWQGVGGVAASSSAMPTAFGLSAAYPNPFRQQTEVALDVPVAGEVRVSVFDVLGRQVAVLLAGEVEAGTHTVRFDAGSLPSGVYLVRAEAAGLAEAQRVTLVR